MWRHTTNHAQNARNSDHGVLLGADEHPIIDSNGAAQRGQPNISDNGVLLPTRTGIISDCLGLLGIPDGQAALTVPTRNGHVNHRVSNLQMHRMMCVDTMHVKQRRILSPQGNIKRLQFRLNESTMRW